MSKPITGQRQVFQGIENDIHIITGQVWYDGKWKDIYVNDERVFTFKEMIDVKRYRNILFDEPIKYVRHYRGVKACINIEFF